jgi:hypothetical protein
MPPVWLDAPVERCCAACPGAQSLAHCTGVGIDRGFGGCGGFARIDSKNPRKSVKSAVYRYLCQFNPQLFAQGMGEPFQ